MARLIMGQSVDVGGSFVRGCLNTDECEQRIDKLSLEHFRLKSRQREERCKRRDFEKLVFGLGITDGFS